MNPSSKDHGSSTGRRRRGDEEQVVVFDLCSSEDDTFSIPLPKKATIERLKKWRQAAVMLNASRRFRYTLDLKKVKEKEEIRRKIRTHAQVVRAALLLKEAREKHLDGNLSLSAVSFQRRPQSVNSDTENELHRIEMGPQSNNFPVSQTRDQPTQTSGNVINEEHRVAIPEPSLQLDRSRPIQILDQDETFKSGVKVAFWATSISASGVIALWTQFLHNQPNSPKCKFFAKASLLSMGASFISGVLIFILSFIRPKFDAATTMVKIFMFAAIVSTALVVGFGVVFYFEKFG